MGWNSLTSASEMGVEAFDFRGIAAIPFGLGGLQLAFVFWSVSHVHPHLADILLRRM